MTIKKFYRIMSQKEDLMDGDGKGGVGQMWVSSSQTRASRGGT